MNEEDITQADNTFQGFFDSLGPNDIYKRIFLEELLGLLYGSPVDLSDVVNWNEQTPEQPPSDPSRSS
jgi:hypothetical protein